MHTYMVLVFAQYTQSKYQQLKDKMNDQTIEYEEKLRAIEARAEDAEKCVNLSHVSVL